MAVMTAKDFYGEVNGDTINGFYKYLDKGVKLYKDRLVQANKVYYEDEACTKLREIWMDLFEHDRIKVNLNSTDSVMSETNVCKLQEAVATYLLFADDAKDIKDDNEEKIVVLDNIRMGKGESRNQSLDSLLDSNNVDMEHKFEVEMNHDNYKLQIMQVITNKDYSDPDIKEVLGDYKDYVDAVNSEIRKIKLEIKNPDDYCTCGYRVEGNYEATRCTCPEVVLILSNNYKIGRRVHELNIIKAEIEKFDMIRVKDGFKGTIYFKAITSSMPVEKYEELDNFDFWDKELIRILAKCESKKCRSEFGKKYASLFESAYKIVSDCLSEQDVEIFELWRESANLQDYADKCDVNHKSIHSKVKAILTMIQRQMIEDYELDYYYTELVKGKWKTCSKCGEVKIANEYYFNKEKTGKDGFRGECKKCSLERGKK